ncbi:MAG: WD40 repeat domain-containing protein [Treponema sp.]|jgi:WD40 repeat protein|nr:WD40 repeat domain-containing protein [Treponema sp.]
MKFVVFAGLVAALFLAAAGILPAQTAGAHRGAVNALAFDDRGRILSAGADGFLGIWSPADRAAVDRYQLSPYPITAMTKRPGESQIAVIESDGLGTYRISAWDYEKKERFFVLGFKDPLSCIGYSASGGFIMAGWNSRTAAVIFIHPETGEILESPAQLSGATVFAATGVSERSMITYTAAGTLSYWELETGEEIRRFRVPANLGNPILFSGNRFLAGIDSQGILVLNAVSGTVITRERSIRRGKLYLSQGDLPEFWCLGAENNPVLYRLALDFAGKLEIKDRLNLSAPAVSVVSAEYRIVLGCSDGNLLALEGEETVPLVALNRRSIEEAAAAGNSLVFLCEGSGLGTIPLDYRELREGMILTLEKAESYNRISAAPENGVFILWQSNNTRRPPVVRSAAGIGRGEAGMPLDKTAGRNPLRAVSVLGNRGLFLDSGGNIRVASLESGELLFSSVSSGSLDAAFADPQTLILGKSTGNAPFLKIDTATRETVPFPSPGLGTRVYRSGSGTLYGVTVTGEADKISVLVRIDPSGELRALAEYPGEDSGCSIAEAWGIPAASLGGEEAVFYEERSVPFQRTQGLPVQLIEAGGAVIVLNGDGALSWHDASGKSAARFSIYGNEWFLETGEKTIRGNIAE